MGHLFADFGWVDFFLIGCSTILSCWHAYTAWFSAASAESGRLWNSQYDSNPKPWPATRCPSLYYIHRHIKWVARLCWCDIAKIYYTLTLTYTRAGISSDWEVLFIFSQKFLSQLFFFPGCTGAVVWPTCPWNCQEKFWQNLVTELTPDLVFYYFNFWFHYAWECQSCGM